MIGLLSATAYGIGFCGASSLMAVIDLLGGAAKYLILQCLASML